MARTVLVCGATGKQGGALIKTLIDQKADLDILAVTRNATSPSAQRLLQKSDRIKLVQGDMADPFALLKTAKEVANGPIWGVFSVQVAMGFGQGGGGELGQGKGLVDAALESGVEFFVYTSVDRHGEKSSTNPTNVPHFIHKHQIEQHLFAKTKGTNMNWTVLRPVAFMDNTTNDFFGRVMNTGWRNVIKDKPFQLVATKDIGFFAAQAFMHPEQYKGQAISLAGDELTLDQYIAVFKRATGGDVQYANSFITAFIMWMMKDFGYMFRWFHDEGYAADIEALRKVHPGLTDFEEWLKTESDFKKTA